ncbi:ABC transporter permease [Mucilaginibacter sp. KACC 22063]|uniref:ABC transporter permease n=1 Tax=Mucilaginibacter sp. KACC 22063 TaxID=3025666 RepID=UPI00236738D1|nr:ABC transporter permease [Mucilaginibacter sp. KACC 22063]WDF56381.1 ABC transporter permease [Mucilaginibacter sp. KACC 22063]
MSISNIKLAWRNIKKDGLYSVINILGLSIATAVFLLIINFVNFEYSYESFHKKADNIYRVTYDIYQGAKYVITDCETHPPLAPLLKKDFPEVVNYVRIQHMESGSVVNYNNQFYQIEHAYASDPSIFDVFDYDLIRGDKNTSLTNPMQVVLTQSQCKRIFGTDDAIGKSLKIGKYLYAVKGVIKDPPLNTHLKIDMLLSFSSLPVMGWNLNSWDGNNNYTYLQLVPGVNLNAFNDKLKAFSRATLKGKLSAGNVFVAEPIKSIHLHSHKSYEPEVNGDAKSVKFMLISAILILLIGSVNYVNLATARSARRIKETGMRKLLGSSKGMLVTQFLSETLFVNVFALAVALIIVWIALPFYFQLVERPLQISFFGTALFWSMCLGLLIFNCLLSGLYPAISLAAIKPIRVVNRVFTASRQSDMLRKALVVGQFATALIVLSASFIVYKQLTYMQKQNLGMDASQILVLNAPEVDDAIRTQQSIALKNALAEIPGVTSVSASGALPGVSQHDISSSTGLSRYESKEGLGYDFYLYGIDARFVPTMQINLAAGENFREGSLNKDEVLINETAARLFGFKNAAEAVGQKLNMNGPVTIKGVIKDYHQLSMKEAIIPMIHYYNDNAAFYSLKLQHSDPKKVLSKVQAIWKANCPGNTLTYRFLNDMFDQQYKNEQRFGKIVAVFSILTLFITCLGILGLTAYNINLRTKEIGIRKVLGASVASIVQLFSLDFVKLIFIAMVIATPIAWYVMNLWLNAFAYRISIPWWVFAITGLTCVIVALATLSFQSVKAAVMKPIGALKAE